MVEEKVEGATKTCQRCNSALTCKLKTYKDYPSRLVWVNQDGSTHYKIVGKNDDGKPEFECNVVSQKSESQKSERLSKHDYEHCPLCPPHYGWVETKNGLKEHMDIWHPNRNEKLTEDDFKMKVNITQHYYSEDNEDRLDV